jgi:hypothetical protein
VHPELNYRIAQLRHEELISSRRMAPARRGWRDLFVRRTRTTSATAGTPPPPIVLLPPPREERDPAGHDQRVA